MTETYTGADLADDIDTDVDLPSASLEQQADEILSRDLAGEDRAFRPAPVHEAVREDAAKAREWGLDRAQRLRTVVEAEPVKASLYALGLGVVIGMLINR